MVAPWAAALCVLGGAAAFMQKRASSEGFFFFFHSKAEVRSLGSVKVVETWVPVAGCYDKCRVM